MAKNVYVGTPLDIFGTINQRGNYVESESKPITKLPNISKKMDQSNDTGTSIREESQPLDQLKVPSFAQVQPSPQQTVLQDKSEIQEPEPKGYSDWEYLLAGATPLLIGMLEGNITTASIGGKYLVEREQKKEQSMSDWIKKQKEMRLQSQLKKQEPLTTSRTAIVKDDAGRSVRVPIEESLGKEAALPISEQAVLNAEEQRRQFKERMAQTEKNYNLAMKRYEQSGDNQKANQLMRLRADYEGNNITKGGNQIFSSYMNIKDIMSRPHTSQSDYALSMQFPKLFDPNSAVLQGEQQIVERAQSFGQQLQNFWDRYAKDKNQKLTPMQRKEFFAIANSIAEATERKQSLQRQNAEYAAKVIGVDPKAVINDIVKNPFPFKIESGGKKATINNIQDLEKLNNSEIDYRVIND